MSNQHSYKVAVDPAVLLEEYQSGMTQDEIAKKHGTTQKVIWREMKNCGFKARRAVARKVWPPHNWKPVVKYFALHRRVESAKGKPKQCGVCGTNDPGKTYDWANLSGQYENIDDYARMCRSCHRRHDHKRRLMKKGLQCQK